MKRKILITGAGGLIGGFLTNDLKADYDLVLTDRVPIEETFGLPFLESDLTDLSALEHACQGVDTVIHLAANRDAQADWKDLVEPNVLGVHNVYQAALNAGCRRVVFASSIHAVLGYSKDDFLETDCPVDPPNIYGATKCWGESLGKYFGDHTTLSVICIRLGWVIPRDSKRIKPGNPSLDIALTLDDASRLYRCCIEAPESIRYRIYHGLSNNWKNRIDISAACREIGYRPQDDAFFLAKHVEAIGHAS